MSTLIDMRVQMYIPDEPAMAQHVLRKQIIQEVGGLTEYPAQGHWEGPHGSVVSELIQVFEFYLEDSPDNRLWVETVALQYKQDAQQQAVLYVVNSHETHWIGE